jgi:hypothetical protein
MNEQRLSVGRVQVPVGKDGEDATDLEVLGPHGLSVNRHSPDPLGPRGDLERRARSGTQGSDGKQRSQSESAEGRRESLAEEASPLHLLFAPLE